MKTHPLTVRSALLAMAAVVVACGAPRVLAEQPTLPRLPPEARQPAEPVQPGQLENGPIVVPPLGSVVPVEGVVQPIDLQSAWRLAGVQNPTINIARMVVQEAEAVQRKAALVWFPNLNVGGMYHSHTGALLSSFGGLRQLDEQSLYFGGGARTVAAESNGIPAVQLVTQLSDALYNPLAARQETTARRFDAQATNNDILLTTTDAYLELLEAEAQWEAYRMSVADTQRVIDTCLAYARTGQGRMGDANRAKAEGFLLLADLQEAEERLAIASAALAQRLQLDPSVRLRPPSAVLQTVDLVDLDQPLANHLRVAVRRRPEMGSASAAVGESQVRVRQEKARPFLPLVQVGWSGGAFGGTGNFVDGIPGFSSVLPRTDFDAMAVWTLQNAGAGNIALIRGRRAEMGEAIYDRVRMENAVRADVAEAYATARALRRQVRVAMRRLEEAEMAYREDYARLRGAEALPIEVLNSVRLLVAARQNLIEVFVGDNRAQFALFVALGQPPFLAAAQAKPLIHPAEQGQQQPQ